MSRFSFTFDTEAQSSDPHPTARFQVALGNFCREWKEQIGDVEPLALADALEWQAHWTRFCYSGQRMDALGERDVGDRNADYRKAKL